MIESLVRVTRAGGEMRSKQGYGASAVEKLRTWGAFDGDRGRLAGRDVTLLPLSNEDLLVLRVA